MTQVWVRATVASYPATPGPCEFCQDWAGGRLAAGVPRKDALEAKLEAAQVERERLVEAVVAGIAGAS